MEDNNNQIETHSNFSSKVHERDFNLMKDRDDCSSMKSLNIFNEHKPKPKEHKAMVIDKEKDMCDTISATSFKSHKSGLSVTSELMVPEGTDYISEEPSDQSEDNIHEEEIEEVDEEEKAETLSEIEEVMKKIDIQIYMLSSQLAPYLDRFGRAVVDVSPHVAMMGVSSHPRNTHNLSNISLLTNDGSIMSASNLNGSRNNDQGFPEQIQRIVNPQTLNRQRHQTALYSDSREAFQEPPRTLSLPQFFINFEVPVMLSPGELVHLDRAQLNIQTSDSPIHLHLTAQARRQGKVKLRQILTLSYRE